MCSVAPCRDALVGLGLGCGAGAATSSVNRRRGVAAVAPANHRPSQKRGRDVEATSSSALRVRMDKELVALQGLLKRAKLLPRSSAAPAAENNNHEPRRSPSATAVPAMSSSSAAKGTTSQPKNLIAKQQQLRPVQREAAAKTETEAPKNKKQLRPEEALARAAAREEFRRMLLEMEKSALPDETVYPEELEELGIYQYARTRTWKQAWLEDHGKSSSIVSVGVACRPHGSM